MKKHHYYINRIGIVAGLGILLSLGSCTDDFEKHNTDPNGANKEQMETDNLLTGSSISQMQMYSIPLDGNAYQRSINLTGDIYGGYLGAIGNWFSNRNNSTYVLQPDWYDVPFEQAYGKVMPAWRTVQRYAEEKSPEVYAVAQIMKVFAMHRISDMHGPIPYSQFGKAEETVPYDSQQEVYKQFFEELDIAINELTDYVSKSPDAKPLKRYDNIYESDFAAWIKFANSLKLRLAIRISYADPATAKTRAEEAINHVHGVMESNDQSAILQTRGSSVIINPLKIIWDEYNDTRLGASFESYLKGYNDPRLVKFFSKATYNADNTHYGVRTGITISDAQRNNYMKFSTPTVEAGDGVLWMAAPEIYFLRAEGALLGWDMGDTPENLYNKGVQVAFEKAGVSGYDAYISDDTSLPSNYKDPSRSLAINASSTTTIKWDNAATKEQKLERIITQKWISLYPDGQEAWSEFRRTNYPRLFKVYNNYSNGIINSDIQIRRLPFSSKEYSNNNAEVVKAAATLLGGGADNGSTKVWWDKK